MLYPPSLFTAAQAAEKGMARVRRPTAAFTAAQAAEKKNAGEKRDTKAFTAAQAAEKQQRIRDASMWHVHCRAGS